MGYKLENLIGKKFGRLTVVEKLPSIQHGIWKKRSWKCLCDCGNFHSAATSNLKKGSVKSCGCLQKQTSAENGRKSREHLINKGMPLKAVKNIYKSNAKKRNLVWDLNDDEALSLLEKDCFYCGLQPSNIYRTRAKSKKYSGIDRLDNNVGYITSNVVSCCSVCNHAKHTMTKEVFLGWLKRIFDYQESRRAIEELDAKEMK